MLAKCHIAAQHVACDRVDMGEAIDLRKVAEHAGWEIRRAAPGSFSIRRGGQTFGPYASVEEARAAIDAEEGKPRNEPALRRE